MKKYIVLALLAMISLPLTAQKTSEEFLSRYNALVSRVGSSGVGVETLLNKWEAALPEDGQMLLARFSYYYGKSVSSQVVKKDKKRFMGSDALLSLDDSTGTKAYYFEEMFYEDSLYALANSYLDKAIRLHPHELDYRFTKIASLIAFEKESPDMATQSVMSLIDYNYSAKPSWTYSGEAFSADQFIEAVQNYCVSFYAIASPAAMESFKSVSEKMLSYNPKNVHFLDNLGGYWLVAKKDHKSALKYYQKALKVAPKDYTALKNILLIARLDKNAKLEKKYLPALIEASPDEAERASAQVRLDLMKK